MQATSPIALVTGAGSGIGKAVSEALLADGYTVVLTGRRLEPLEAVAQASGSERAHVFPADVSQVESVDALFAMVAQRFGRLDVLFNNAGVFAPAVPMEDITFEQWKQVVDINLTGSFLCAQRAMRLMKSQTPQGGRIINNGSISAHVPRPHSAPYTATKHAMTGLTKSISLDGRKHNIACSQIDIGNAMTDMAAPMTKGVLQAHGAVAVEPVMDVRHVGEAVLHMARLPLSANVQFMTLMATNMPYIGRG